MIAHRPGTIPDDASLRFATCAKGGILKRMTLRSNGRPPSPSRSLRVALASTSESLDCRAWASVRKSIRIAPTELDPTSIRGTVTVVSGASGKSAAVTQSRKTTGRCPVTPQPLLPIVTTCPATRRAAVAMTVLPVPPHRPPLRRRGLRAVRRVVLQPAGQTGP